MIDSERKSKMISLRLSDAEYAVLKTQFRAYGARNVSDLARLALQQVTQSPVPQQGVLPRLAELEERIQVLESEMSRIRPQAQLAR